MGGWRKGRVCWEYPPATASLLLRVLGFTDTAGRYGLKLLSVARRKKPFGGAIFVMTGRRGGGYRDGAARPDSRSTVVARARVGMAQGPACSSDRTWAEDARRGGGLMVVLVSPPCQARWRVGVSFAWGRGSFCWDRGHRWLAAAQEGEGRPPEHSHRQLRVEMLFTSHAFRAQGTSAPGTNNIRT